jgi:hypothetical protein
MTTRNVFLAVLLAVALFNGRSAAQMVDPAMDRNDEPFCYYSKPTDVLGVMDGKEGTLVTPEGYLYTGYGEIMFFAGNPPEPVSQRVKTLYKGYLPVIDYEFTRNQVVYHVRMFAATLDGDPESPLMNFVRVTLRNGSRSKRSATFGIGTRYQSEANTSWGFGDNRFRRPVKAKVLGQYEQAGVEFNREWEYGFESGMFVRDGSAMYLFDPSIPHHKWLTLKSGYNEVHSSKPEKLYVPETTPVGIVISEFTLAPGENRQMEFRVPYEPIVKESPLIQKLREAGFDDYLARTVNFWDGIFAQGIDIQVPEDKVVNTFKANLVYDLIARNKQDGSYIQKVNEFNYDAFWLRDAAYIVRMYDLSGYHEIARQCLDFFPRWQQPDGNFVSQGGQYDGWGQTMWAYGQHYRITRDTQFAEGVFPAIVKAVEWLKNARAQDPFHVMPTTTPGDNEDISGHVTGHNFWALAGLKNVIALAEGIGKTEEATAFREEYDGLLAALRARLQEITRSTDGYMPPGLDSLGGQDWGNMLSVYPEVILDPLDPMVTATLKTTRAKYQEGIMTYGDGRWLHHYLTMKNTETEIVRGDQQIALEELYAMLVHTSATHAGFEFAILPWATRDFGMNLSPHGWFSAKFRAMMRNMMVREQGDQLHLFSCLSPEWVKKGAQVAVRRAPTNFGGVDLRMRCQEGKATIDIQTTFSRKPESLVLHLPWFMAVSSVKAGGKGCRISGGTVVLPPDTRSVEIRWAKKRNTPSLNFTGAVNVFKKEYRKRYEESLKTGNLID